MRWTICAFALATLFGIAGCGPKPVVTTPNSTPNAAAPRPTDPAPVAAAPDPGQPAPGTGAALNPTNTGVNTRDRDPDAKTPLDQANDEISTKITATIRKQITDTAGMSVNARNVKIITEANRITLRGPVASLDEKTKIEGFAKEAAPVNFQVINMLEVP